MRVLFGLCTIGLGHATRSLPIIEALLNKGHEVTVVSYGATLNLLRKQLGHRVRYRPYNDFNLPVVRIKSLFVPFTILRTPLIEWDIGSERRMVRRWVKEDHYDLIISDGRLGMDHPDVPCYLINHQLRLMTQNRWGWVEDVGEKYMVRHSKRYTGVIIPDDPEVKLAGEMAHNLSYYDRFRLLYPGFLSSFSNTGVEADIDTLITATGPDPGRSEMIDLCRRQARNLAGKTVLMTGRDEPRRQEGNLSIIGLVDNEEREVLINRARRIVARCGYTSLMDLMILGKPALLMPTIGQTEQEYLARYLQHQGYFRITTLDRMNLPKQLRGLENTRPYHRPFDTADSVRRILDWVGA